MRTRVKSIRVNQDPPQTANVLKRTLTGWNIGLPTGYYGLPLLPGAPATLNRTWSSATELLFRTDTIVDEVGSDRRIKFCDHTKLNPRPFEAADSPNSGLGTLYSRTVAKGTVTQYHAGIVANSFEPYHVAWKAARNGCLVSLDTTINEASLINSLDQNPESRLGELPARIVRAIEEWNASTTLVESRDFPALFALATKRGPLGGVANAIIKYKRSLTDLSKTFRGQTARDTVRRLLAAYRSGHLGYAFGLMPTVSDVRTISDVLSRGIKARNSRIVRSLQGKGTSKRSATSAGTNGTYGQWNRVESIDMLRVDGCVAELKRPLIRSSLDNYVKRLVGVNGARLIWDVIPWSFCVDWFLSVDDALDTLYLGSQTEYDVSYWTSTKLTYAREVTAYHLQNAGWTYVEPVPFERWQNPLRVEWSHYHRTPVPPPRVLDSFRYRMGATQVWLTVLLGLGLVPKKFQNKILLDR